MSSKHRKAGGWASLQGLLLVVLLLGHDLLMCAVVYATPASPAVSSPATLHHSGKATAVPPGHEHAPKHPSLCGTTIEAVIASDPDRDTAIVAVHGAAVDHDACNRAAAGTSRWAEPLWPPGTLRAWLQVYRI